MFISGDHDEPSSRFVTNCSLSLRHCPKWGTHSSARGKLSTTGAAANALDALREAAPLPGVATRFAPGQPTDADSDSDGHPSCAEGRVHPPGRNAT